MCDPVSITAATLAIGSAGVGYQAASDNASATEKYNAAVIPAATQAYDSSTTQGQTQEVYQQIKAANAIEETQRQGRAGEATAVNAAGEDGIGGNTMMELSRDYYNRAGRAAADINQQRDAADDQIHQQIVGAGFQFQDRLNQRKPVVEPNFITPALSAAGSITNSITRIKPAWAVDLFPSLAGGGNQGEGD